MKLGIIAAGACLAGAMLLTAAPPQPPHRAKGGLAGDPGQKEQAAAKSPTASSANAASIARGKYLVGPAGQCGDCHTPMDKSGKPVKSQELQGAPIMFKPTAPVPSWADMSLPIAGLPTMASDEDAISFFTTGKHLDGKTAAPPMPQYRFSKKDAEAIVAYLKSLGR